MPLREVVGNIWQFDCTMRVVPTNGFVKKSGLAVMGAGLAKQAAARYPNLPEVLGRCIEFGGNHVHVIRHDLISFPTKDNWWDDSDISLIERSALELIGIAQKQDYKLVALPRVGTGNGKLRWTHVKPILADILGDDPRFVIVDTA